MRGKRGVTVAFHEVAITILALIFLVVAALLIYGGKPVLERMLSGVLG